MSEKCSVYTVVSGDNLTLIARRFGFRDYQTIYDHEVNTEFKKLRPDPSVIFPGDKISIPNKVMKSIPAKEGEVVVCRVVKEKEIVPIKQIGILPVRYAFSDKIAESLNEQQEQIDSTDTNLESGLMSSGMRDYTLRQLRDGWLYVYNDTKGELDEYQITGSTYTKYDWDTVEQHTNSQAGDAKSILLYNEGDKLAVSFALLRWTDRVCEHMTTDAASRNAWMRQLDMGDYKSAPHTADITKLSELVADVDIEGDVSFNNTCTPLSDPGLEGNKDGLVLHKGASVEIDHTADLPDATEAIIVALDDSLADVKDLYLALSQPQIRHSLVMGSTEDEIENNSQKWEMAQFMRGLERVQLEESALPELVQNEPKLQAQFEIDFNEHLKIVEWDIGMNNGVPVPRPESVTRSIKARLKESSQYLKDQYDFTPTDDNIEHWLSKNTGTYNNEIDWPRLNEFVKEFEPGMKKNPPLIKQAHQDLLSAARIIGTDAMKLGLDVENADSVAHLLHITEALTSALMLTALDEDANNYLKAFLSEEGADNLFALTTSCFFKEHNEELEDWMRLHNNYHDDSSRQSSSIASKVAPLVTRIAEYQTMMGYNAAAAEGVEWYIKLQSAIQRRLNAFKTAAKGKAASQWIKLDLLFMSSFRPSDPVKATKHDADKMALRASIREMAIGKGDLYDEAIEAHNKKLKVATEKLKVVSHSPFPNGLTKKQAKKSRKNRSKAMTAASKEIVTIRESKPDLLEFKDKAIQKQAKQITEQFGKVAKGSAKIQDFVGEWGGTASVVAGLNFLMLTDKVAEYVNDYDFLNEQEKSRFVKESGTTLLWTISAVSEAVRGVYWNQVQNNNTLLLMNLKDVAKSKSLPVDTKILARNFGRSVAIMASFGAVASIAEIYLTQNEINDATGMEKLLLQGKLTALVISAGSYSASAVTTLASRAFGRGAVASVFAPLFATMLSIAGFAYLVFSVFSSVFKKTPLEKWVTYSTWGTNTKDWTLGKELLEYNKIMRKPQVEFSYEGSNYIPSSYDPKQVDKSLYKNALTMTLPGLDKYEEFEMAITTYPDINGREYMAYANGAIPVAAKLPEDVIDDGEWKQLDGAWQYKLNIETEYSLKKVIVYIIVKVDATTDIIYAAKGSNGEFDVMTPDRIEHPNEFEVNTLGVNEYGY